MLKQLPLFMMTIKSEIKSNPLPGAILWVESELRPQFIRYVEYMCLKLYPSEDITVGLSQMKVKYWKMFVSKFTTDVRLSVKIFENPRINFFAVSWYLSHFEYSSLLDVSKVYTGRYNYHYASLLQKALLILHPGYQINLE